MKTAELLKAFAEDLERENNEALLLSEESDEAMSVVAAALVQAATILRAAAERVDGLEPVQESLLTPDALEEMAAIAQAFDESGDELLQKQASVLDEILLTIAAPKDAKAKRADAEEKRIELLKQKYNAPELKEEQDLVAEALEALKKNEYMKNKRPLEAPLQTRYCPDHAGVQMARLEEGRYQCALDGKVFDYENGFKTEKGETVPGTSVQNQTEDRYSNSEGNFSTRETRLGS